MNLLKNLSPCLLLLLAACASTGNPSHNEDAQASEKVETHIGFRTPCEPVRALLDLKFNYPQTRFVLRSTDMGPQDPPVELKFHTRRDLETTLGNAGTGLLWVDCKVNGRAVSVNVSHGHLQVHAGPVNWQLRGLAREPVTDFVAAVKEICSNCGLATEGWTLRWNPMSFTSAKRLCAAVGITEVRVTEAGTANVDTTKPIVPVEKLNTIPFPYQATAEVGSGKLYFIFFDRDVALSADVTDTADFLRLAQALERPVGNQS